MDGAGLRTRLDVLPDRPVSRLRTARGRGGRRDHVLHRLDPVHRRRRAADDHRLPRTPCRRGRTGRVPGRGDPVGRHVVLQRHHLSGAAHVLVGSQLQPARVAPGRIGLDLLPGLGTDRLSRLSTPRLATRARAPRLVGARDQPARLRLLRHRGRRGLPGALDRLAAQPRVGELDHCAGRRVLPGLRGRHATDRPYAQITAATTSAQAGARPQNIRSSVHRLRAARARRRVRRRRCAR